MDKITFDNYREYPAINYSKLSALDKSPMSLNKEDKDYSDAMKMGDALDTLITGGEKEFKNKFTVDNIKKPTSSLLLLADSIIEIAVTSEIVPDEEMIENTRVSLGLWSNMVDKEKIKDKWDNKLFNNYVDYCIKNKDKIFLSEEELNCIYEAKEVLFTHEFTKDYFIGSEDVEIKFQVPLLFNYKDKLYKSLLDIVKLDHKNKKVYPCDLKFTSDGVWNFPNKILKWRYDIQSSMYYHSIINEYKDSDYSIEPFRFIVVSSVNPTIPMVYNAKNLIDMGRDGKTLKNGKKVKGWEQLSEELIWHQENDMWEYKKEIYDKKELTLEIE